MCHKKKEYTDGKFYVSTWLDHRMPRHLAGHYFRVSVRWVSIGIGRLSTADCPPQTGCESCHFQGSKQNRMTEEGRSYFPCLLSWAVNLSLPLDLASHHWLPWFSGLQNQAEVTTPAFLGLQFIDSRWKVLELLSMLVLFLWHALTTIIDKDSVA